MMRKLHLHVIIYNYIYKYHAMIGEQRIIEGWDSVDGINAAHAGLSRLFPHSIRYFLSELSLYSRRQVGGVPW